MACNRDKQQEEEVIERIICTYGNDLLRICTIYLKDSTLAEDVVQDTLIKVYQKYSTFKHQSEEKTWVMKIAMNTCRNYMRSNWFRRVSMGLPLETISEVQVDEVIVEDAKEKQLLLEIANLSKKYKEVILLYYYQEMPTKKIAEVLGIKEGAVRVRLQRAREKLTIKLQEVNMDEKCL